MLIFSLINILFYAIIIAKGKQGEMSMNTIKYKGKEYQISDKIAQIVKTNMDNLDFIIELLESENYKAGKIKDDTIIRLLPGNVFTKHTGKEILISKIYGDGLISDSLFLKLVLLHATVEFSILEKEYSKGNLEDAKVIFEIMDKANSINRIRKIINIILTMLPSSVYKEKAITKETLELLNEATNVSLEMLQKALDNEFRNAIDEETIRKILLEEQNELVNAIIECILASNIIKPEEKNDYIKAIINLENKEELNNLYNLYAQKDESMTLYEFANNFVRFTLVLDMQKFNLASANPQHTRKKQLNNK